ncbi:hypothetical protein AAFF_G00208790 [Aldrovandia affinis]|uniref:NADH dehydrogenase [ubiquinone] 1 alpha subcomplex subunit 10, mitochondrial n=1 Tax=Aldrovandia affinis TaxID=143900 RepID=A0AAD7W5E6_9TELE|nr:hypothetical protein AAFF_G00208790 [Aldrovandia affinis]
MALRVIRRLVPSGAAAIKAGSTVHTARIHCAARRPLQYGWLAYILGERTTPRLTQNSRIITIDGSLASGKGALARSLADKLGMLYLPEAGVHYLDRATGEAEPLHTRFNGNCSLETFYRNPHAPDGNSYRLQSWMYHVRLLQYSDAIEHLLTTGQGVVLERSPFSDMVFLEAMFKQGYIRKQCVEHYNEIKNISICEFLPPHLVIYLDVPAEEVQRRLQQSGQAHLQNVPLAYLKSIEEAYKKSYLPSISEHAELLAYDATQAHDIERVVEDIESLKFVKGQWAEQDDTSYHYMRMLVEDKPMVASLTCVPNFLPEVTIGAHDVDEAFYAYKSLPGKRYAPGFNMDAGDKQVWLK